MENIIGAFHHTRNDAPSTRSLRALQQTYGYMTFNNNKYGILSNWKRALFLRRAETPDRKTLEYYVVELDGPLSMLKAWVGIVLLAEENWFYASPTTPAGLNFRASRAAWEERKVAVANAEEYDMQPTINVAYDCVAIDFGLIRFDHSFVRRGASGCIVRAQFVPPSVGGHSLEVVCKAVDMLRYPDAANTLEGEASAYATLQDLQGEVIPTVHGFYEIWGILRFLALEPVGNAISEEEEIDHALRMRMRAALQRIHDAGYIHGDIARRNFCRKENNDVFLVDLESCRSSTNLAELANEMNKVDAL